MSSNPETKEPQPLKPLGEKARTLSIFGLGKRKNVLIDSIRLASDIALVDETRPRRRGDCVDDYGRPKEEMRPCPYVGCSQHLYLDVNPANGSIKLNFPDIKPDELHLMEETCALDVADRSDHTLEQVGEIMNFTRERTRQIETDAYSKMQHDIGSGYDDGSIQATVKYAEHRHKRQMQKKAEMVEQETRTITEEVRLVARKKLSTSITFPVTNAESATPITSIRDAAIEKIICADGGDDNDMNFDLGD